MDDLLELVKKLEYEKLSAQNLSNELREDVKELTQKLLALKKENLTLKAERGQPNTATSTSASGGGSSDTNEAIAITTTDDSKNSGQSKTNQ